MFAAIATTDADGVCSLPVPLAGDYELTVDVKLLPDGLTVAPDRATFTTQLEPGIPRTVAIRLVDADAPTEEEVLAGAPQSFRDRLPTFEAGEGVPGSECGLLPIATVRTATGLDLEPTVQSAGASTTGLSAGCSWVPAGAATPEVGAVEGLTSVLGGVEVFPPICEGDESETAGDLSTDAVSTELPLDRLQFDP